MYFFSIPFIVVKNSNQLFYRFIMWFLLIKMFHLVLKTQANIFSVSVTYDKILKYNDCRKKVLCTLLNIDGLQNVGQNCALKSVIFQLFNNVS